jgi:uncharacterized damage-inducible protein DinB
MVAGAAAAPLVLSQAPAAGSEIDTWVGWWTRSKAYTVKVAEAMPADSYGFKGAEGVNTFGYQVKHIAQAEGFYLGRFGKGAAPQAPASDTDKAAIVAYLNQAFDWSIATVKQLTPADLTKAVGGGKGPAMTGLDLLLNAMVHTAHTRGYIDMYLREKGIKPPTYQV